MTKKKQTKGRQKVEMVKMKNNSNLQVTFSKRRAGLFKKASELCTLCAAEILIIVFSPGLKAYTFGHPNVEDVMDRYLNPNPEETSTTMQLIKDHRIVAISELNTKLTEVNNELDAAKKYGEELDKTTKEIPFEELSLSQLLKMKYVMQKLKKDVERQAKHLHFQNTNSQQFFIGSSSYGGLTYGMKNNVAFNANMMPEGYNALNMIPPLPRFNLLFPELSNPGFGDGSF